MPMPIAVGLLSQHVICVPVLPQHLIKNSLDGCGQYSIIEVRGLPERDIGSLAVMGLGVVWLVNYAAAVFVK